MKTVAKRSDPKSAYEQLYTKYDEALQQIYCLNNEKQAQSRRIVDLERTIGMLLERSPEPAWKIEAREVLERELESYYE